MKFWLFQSNQVNGPYEPEDLSALPAYSPESLVCPEGRKGTSMGDWQRAGMIPELSVSLLKASAGAVAAKGGGGGNRYDFPPEPTLKDLAALGSLQEKFQMLENTVIQLQEEMRRKDSELSELDKELAEKTTAVADLKGKLEGIEDRVSHIAVLQGELDKAVAAEKEVQSDVEVHRLTLARLNEQIDKLKADVSGIDALKAEVQDEAGQIEKLKAEVREIDQLKLEVKSEADDIEGLKAGIKELEGLRADLKELEAKQAKTDLPEPEAKRPEPIVETRPFAPPPAVAAPPPTPPPVPAASPVPLPFEFSPLAAKTPVIDKPAAGLGLPAAPPPASESAKPSAADSIPGAVKEEGKPARSKAPFIAAAVVLLATGGLYFSGALKPKRSTLPPPPADDAPLTPPLDQQIPAAPPPVPPEVLEEQAKAAAVTLVKEWPAADGKQTLGSQLDAAFPPAGGLAPWMAEKTSEGVYQVNYYSPKSAANPKQTVYQFESRLGDRSVLPHDEATKALMSGAPAAPAPKKKKVRVKAKPVEAEPGDDLFKGMPGAEPETAAPAKDAGEAPAGDLMLPPSAAPAKSNKKKSKVGPKAADAELLDDLLKP